MKRRGDPKEGMRTVVLGAVLATAMLGATLARADVFDGDPIDPATGGPRLLLPGVPLVHPGFDDDKYGNGDDIFDLSFVGDVDLVLRTGGTYAGGPFPPPAAGLGAAPVVQVGGETFGGSDLAFDVMASDGAASPAAGNPLTDADLDTRGALVFAFADLDGDGFVGPTHADGDTTDLEIERQEVLTPVGRQVAVFLAGRASGGLGVSLGAPASAGGLGLAIVGGAVTGASPPLFSDGTWIATLLPFMPSADPGRILGGNPRAPDPAYLADVELEITSDRHWLPIPSHPVIGTPFAIPLDGSSVTVDLARAESGPGTRAGLGIPIDSAHFVALPGRRILAARNPSDTARVLVDPAPALVIADDGPGSAATLLAFAADLLGNPADPASALAVGLEVGAALRITSPDTDGDPARETVTLSSAASAAIVIDDAGAADDLPADDRVVAIVEGVPSAAIDVRVGAGGPLPTPGAWQGPAVVLQLGSDPALGSLRLTGTLDADPGTVNPAAQDLTLTLEQDGAVLYARTFPAGSLSASPSGRRFALHDPAGTSPRTRKLTLAASARDPRRYRVSLSVRPLDLRDADPNGGALTLKLQVGTASFTSTLPCTANGRETVMRCAQP